MSNERYQYSDLDIPDYLFEDESDSILVAGNLTPTSNLKTIYAYFLDSSKFLVKDPSTAIEMFNIAHHIFLEKLTELNSQNSYLPSYFLKAYYKFRHNVFSFLCNYNFLNCPLTLETDVSLKKWINSEKTPDFIYEFDGTLYLIEYTVSNSYESVDFYKGGGNQPVKYSHEAELISFVTNKPCLPVIIPAVLNEYNIDEIDDIFNRNFKLSLEIKKFLQEFFSISNSYRSIINLNNARSNQLSTEFKPLIEGKFERPSLMHIKSFSPEFISKLLTNWNYLSTKVVALQIRGNSHHKFSLHYDLLNNSFFFVRDKKYLKLSDWDFIFKEKNISALINNLEVFEGNVKVSLEKLRGDTPISLQRNKSTFINIKWNYSPLNVEVFNREFADYSDKYKTKTFFDEADILSDEMFSKVDFPPDYFQKLSSLPLKPFLDSKTEKMLGNCIMDELQIEESLKLFSEKYDFCNMRIGVFYPKQTFMIPLVSQPLNQFDLESLNKSMMEHYLRSGSGKYTQRLLLKAINNQYCKNTKSTLTDSLHKLRQKVSDCNSEYYTFLRDNEMIKKYRSMSKSEKDIVKPIKDKCDSAIFEYKKLLADTKSAQSNRIIKLRLSKKNMGYKDFKSEMSHYSKSGSIFAGVGNVNDNVFEGLSKFMNNFCDFLLKPNFHDMKLNKLYNTDRSPGPDFLNKQKDLFTTRWDYFYDHIFSGTFLDQWCEFASRLAKTLFNESVKTYNKDYVKIDNLGFDNIIVLIRGGPKIYKNQRSKLYKVFFYIRPDDLVYSGYSENSSYEKLTTPNGTMIVTPWSQLHQDVLFDMMNIRHRTFMNLYTTRVRNHINPEDPFPKLALLPTLLFFHNRRKTEEFMHNSRYLIVNPLGLNANIKGIIETFADFNYTYFESYLREMLKRNYSKFGGIMLKIRGLRHRNIDEILIESNLCDLWFNEPIVNADQLTSFIYTTYMMTKAPVNSSIEQANNLWSVLEDVVDFETNHNDVQGLNDKSLRFDILRFDETTYNDDFKYDPVFCQFLGHYLAGYLESSIGILEIHNIWINIKNQDLDVIANSNGLRGWNEKNFFNKKGYEVVYSYVQDVLESEDIEIKNLVDQYLSLDQISAAATIQNDKISLSTDEPLNKLVFHIVHKIQRGGNREIFCMDLNTKRAQNPLEKFFKHLCKRIPNEFISVPSNRRHAMIHTDFFEKGPGSWVKQIVRWVLDCRRWAPHSVFQKYVHFIHGMAPVLPADFLNDFNNFSVLMFEKEFHTREHVISKMKNNERYSKYKHLIEQSGITKDGYKFQVKFSFVMGIFNYLSTLLHSANQLVASECIRNICLSNNLGLVTMDPKCHSDDSVVSSYHEKEESIRPSVLLYDWFLKGANHMLSVKKSQINLDVYLEFLSILYMFDRFMPVIPKFNSSLPFKPSDNGYTADISFAITQSIEMLSQGGTFEESFLMLKVTERYVQDIYNINFNKNLPFHFLGTIDSHPIELLLAGGNADLMRHLSYNTKNMELAISILKDQKLIDNDNTANHTLKWDMSARLNPSLRKKFNKLKEVSEELSQKYPWTLENCKLGNSKLNLIWFYNKLNDPKYYSSLIDEPDARRYSRVFGAGGYRNLKDLEGKLVPVSKATNLLSCIDLFENYPTRELTDFSKTLNVLCSDLLSFYDAIENMSVIESLPSNLKDKPVNFTATESFIGNIKLNANQYIVYKKEFEAFKLLGLRSNPIRSVNKFDDYLRSLEIDVDSTGKEDLYLIAQRLMSGSNRTYKLIASVDSSNRNINSFSSMVSMMETNSIKHQKFKFNSRNAAIVDWKRKIMQGKVPQTVIECVENYWAWSLCVKYKVDEIDIYETNPKELFFKTLSLVPLEWKPVISSFSSENRTALINQVFWTYWEREQVRVGYNWFGPGTCWMNLPEILIKFNLSNGVVNEIQLDNNFLGDFSIPSSWYLRNLLSHSNLQTEFILSDYGDPDKYYLGYNTKRCTYGIGRSKIFDLIYLNTNVIDLHGPEFIFHLNERKRLRSSFVYIFKDREYKINFFLPTQEDITLDLSKFVSKEKIKNNYNNPLVKDFVFKVSLEKFFDYRFEQDAVIDNIGRSTLFKIVRNHPNFRSIYDHSSTAEDPFLESIMLWKKINPDFGFPSEVDLEQLLKSKDVPNMPQRLMKLLNKLGHSNRTAEEIENIYLRICQLDPDDRLNFVLSAFPNLTDSEAFSAIVIAVRNQRMFDSCQWLSKQTFQILSPLISLISTTIEVKKLHSPTLTSLTEMINWSLKTEYSETTVLKFLFARVVLNGMWMNQISSAYDKNAHKIFTIISELLDNGLGVELNIMTIDNPVFRATDFTAEKSKILNWIIDVFDSLYYSVWVTGKMRVDTKKWIWEGGKYSNEISEVRAQAVKFKIDPFPLNLEFTVRKKRNNETWNLKHERSKPGVTKIDFLPLDEDSQDEFETGYTYDEDILDYCHFEESAKLKRFCYTTVPVLTDITAMGIRGGAWNVLVGCLAFTPSFFQTKGNIYIFKKNGFNSITDYFSSENQYIVAICKYKQSISINNYKLLPWQDYIRLSQPSVFIHDEILISDKKHKKDELIKNTTLRTQIPNIEHYFQNLRQISVIDDAKTVDEQLDLAVKMGIRLRDDFEIVRLDLKKQLEMLNKIELKEEEEKEEKKSNLKQEEKQETESQNVNLTESDSPHDSKDSVLKSLSNVFEKLQNIDFDKKQPGQSNLRTIKNELTRPVEPYKFKEPLKAMTDPFFLGEFNAFFNGFWDKFVNNELRLSKKTKKRKLEYARYKISTMPGYMRSKYKKLYLIVSCLLQNIDDCEYRQAESYEFAAQVEDIFDVDLENEEDIDFIGYDLEVESGEIISLPDLNKIFS